MTDNIARYGYDKNKDGMPQIKYLVLFSLKNQRPVWFTELPGNVADVVTVNDVINELKALGIKKVTFVTDNGYFSELNIGEMLGQGYNFITLGDVDSKWIELEIDKYYKTVQNIIYACPFDLDTHGFTCSITRNFVWTRITPSKTKKLKAGDKDIVRAFSETPIALTINIFKHKFFITPHYLILTLTRETIFCLYRHL